MSTTTIRLSKDLKERVARAASRAGTTAHGFILEAIAEKAQQQELQTEFHELAVERFQKILATGKTIPWSEMKSYLVDRAAGKKTAKPKARVLSPR
ncbi:MAG TPA: DUF1778 domain-containing protein [Burkholderiales bacterium]|nr:DUF1778 domain-containing protein [Burkholderiales bacterium]